MLNRAIVIFCKGLKNNHRLHTSVMALRLLRSFLPTLDNNAN